MAGRPKAAHLKVISGTNQPCREREEIEVELLETVPSPPSWLSNSHAVTEWKRLAPMLVANRVLAETDLAQLGHLCSLHGKLVQLWAAGECPHASMLATYNKLASDFGLSAMARGRIKNGPGKKPEGNAFGKFKKPTPAG